MSEERESPPKNQQNNPLTAYSRNVASQFGEDGILERVFSKLPEGDRWCVEFGAWDGKLYSNTWNLIVNHNWASVQIESDPRKFQQLTLTHRNRANVFCLQQQIGFSGPNTLDAVLASTPVPSDFDFLSIDVDGNDYHLWESLTNYKPKVVLIEFNATIPTDVEFINPKDLSVQQGSSLKATCRLAQEKGYELICVTECNALFVTRKYFDLFGIDNNDFRVMADLTHVTRLFQLYDGTIVLDGCRRLLWENRDIAGHIQILPRFLRKFNKTPWQRWIFSIYMNIRQHIHTLFY